MMKFKYPETEEYVQTVIDYLKEKFGEVRPVWVKMIELLGNENDMYLLAKEDIEQNGICLHTKRGLIQSPSLKSMHQSAVQIQKLANSLGITPNSSIKLKLQSPGQEEDEEDFLDALTK